MDLTEPLILGNPTDATQEDALRAGGLRFRSRKGLRGAERLLVEALPPKAPGTLLCGFDSEGTVALAAARLWGADTRVTWWHLDAYVAEKVRRTLAQNEVKTDVRCAADLPGVAVPGEPPPAEGEGPFDVVALPFPRGQEAQLGRELIEEAHAALKPGGRLLAATDDRRGEWLNRVLRDVFGNSTIVHDGRRQGLCFGAKRTKARAEVRDHRHPITTKLRGRELRFDGRPGTFGYSHLDAGTKALADGAEVRPGDAALDLGCGYGVLGIAVAAECARVTLVDSNARAVALAARNAAANGAHAAEVLLRADLEDLGGRVYDLVLMNPPYYSNWRIARSFIDTAASVLRPGGRLWLVAKAAAQHADLVGERFHEVRTTEAPSGHGLVCGILPG